MTNTPKQSSFYMTVCFGVQLEDADLIVPKATWILAFIFKFGASHHNCTITYPKKSRGEVMERVVYE